MVSVYFLSVTDVRTSVMHLLFMAHRNCSEIMAVSDLVRVVHVYQQ